MRSTFWSWEAKLAPDYCQHLIDSYFSKEKQITGGVHGNNENFVTRKTNVCWIQPMEPISLLMFNHALIANQKAGWLFDVEHIEPVQIGHYADGGHYDWHPDMHILSEDATIRARKLSVVVMLSDPSTYEGGVLQLGKKDTRDAPNSQGTIIVFPSMVEHRVTPVTAGDRYTLVGWCGGPDWR